MIRTMKMKSKYSSNIIIISPKISSVFHPRYELCEGVNMHTHNAHQLTLTYEYPTPVNDYPSIPASFFIIFSNSHFITKLHIPLQEIKLALITEAI